MCNVRDSRGYQTNKLPLSLASAGCHFLDRENDENWVLEPYQRGGSVKTFWKHIEKACVDSDSVEED